MDLTFAVLALLPLGLFSFFSRGRGAHAGLAFLAALAPVIISAVKGIIDKKRRSNAAKKQTEFDRQQFDADEAQNRAKFDAAQNSPQAQMRRMGFNSRLASILGQFGGRGQTPQFILDSFDAARGRQEYTPGAEFVEAPKSGGGFLDYANIGLNAASNFDLQRFKGGRAGESAGSTPGEAPAAAPSSGPLLPSSFRSQDFKLGPTPAADEFLSQRRKVPGR